MLAGSVAFIGCNKNEDDLAPVNKQEKSSVSFQEPSLNEGFIANGDWIENFKSPVFLKTNWLLYGTPRPKWVYQACGQQGLFDNNGPSPSANYAVSNISIGNGNGYALESKVYMEILNPKGRCVCPGIGVTKYLNPGLNGNGEIESGIFMRIMYAGANATWVPEIYRGHTWFQMGFLGQNGSFISPGIYSLSADGYVNGWHLLKIVVSPTRMVKFYCDNNVIWASAVPLHESIAVNKNILLGFTSAGNNIGYVNAGRAYHDYVKVHFFYPETIESNQTNE